MICAVVRDTVPPLTLKVCFSAFVPLQVSVSIPFSSRCMYATASVVFWIFRSNPLRRGLYISRYAVSPSSSK